MRAGFAFREVLSRLPNSAGFVHRMSVSQKDLQGLSSLLLPDQIGQQNLESLSDIVQKQFAKSEHFKICRVLVFLLHHDFLYDALSRFTALFLLWDMCKSEPLGLSPFTDFFRSYLQDDVTTKLPWSALFVLHSILTQPEQVHEFLKYTPLQIANLSLNNANRKLDWSFLQTDSQSTASRLPQSAACGTPCVVPDKDVPPSLSLESSSPTQLRRHCLETLLSHNEPVASLSGLRPEFIRVAPPLLPTPQGCEMKDIVIENKSTARANMEPVGSMEKEGQSDVEPVSVVSGWSEELIWLNPPTIHHEFHWDTNSEQATPTVELRCLIAKALTSSLSQSEQQTVVHMIKDNTNLVYNLGITPENLPNLVNHGLVIAMELLTLMKASPQMDEYYDALISMEPTVNALEIVNRLASTVDLPKQFIHAYICKCMSYCQSLQDKSTQLRHVRLVCVLFQSFIRNKILDVRKEDITVEIQRFCLDFNKVSHANQLYRLIKNMEPGAPGSLSPSNTTHTDSPIK
ncbi:hypothetical protein P879_04885 [Paragonimus westermani]|uniref:CCR4-NOT transcription complex subunit 11 n=1 Tax=Paragonimus westermani TaxID=34504 RepID=A0A8T0DGY4_9TREM|nr:hypothetical protein P879_04885 [Paragonimus westermani]